MSSCAERFKKIGIEEFVSPSQTEMDNSIERLLTNYKNTKHNMSNGSFLDCLAISNGGMTGGTITLPDGMNAVNPTFSKTAIELANKYLKIAKEKNILLEDDVENQIQTLISHFANHEKELILMFEKFNTIVEKVKKIPAVKKEDGIEMKFGMIDPTKTGDDAKVATDEMKALMDKINERVEKYTADEKKLSCVLRVLATVPQYSVVVPAQRWWPWP